MDRFITFINTSDGRDKGGKIIQYGSRFIQWQQKDINKEVHESFKNLYTNFSNARKLFRMLKFLIEYKNIRALLGKAENMKLHKFILALIPRVAFFFYWFLDTIIVMIKIKVLKNWDAKNITHKWALLWTIANFTGILGALVELYELATEEVKLIASKNVSQQDAQKNGNDDTRQKLSEVKSKRFKAVLNVIKCSGDSITSTSMLGWPKAYLGFEFNDGHIGLGGLASAVIGCYSTYPAAKK